MSLNKWLSSLPHIRLEIKILKRLANRGNQNKQRRGNHSRSDKYNRLNLVVNAEIVHLRGNYYLVAHSVKNLPAMQETRFWFLGQEDPLEKEMATHSRTLAWRIPWREEPGRLLVHGVAKSQTQLSYFTFTFTLHISIIGNFSEKQVFRTKKFYSICIF